jgi:hypothetical protein
MALRDIVTLDTDIAPKLLRILYPFALMLISLMFLLGVAQGIRTIASPPRPPMMAGTTTPPTAPQSGILQPPPVPGMMGRGMMGPRGAYGRRPFRRPGGLRAANPVLAGTFMIVLVTLMAAILMMVVRILAEMALAVLALPKRNVDS